MTDPSREESVCGCGCYSGGLECIFSILRALRMGSCFSAESRSPSSPSGFRKRKSYKRRLGSTSSSFEYWRNEPVHRIPGRIFLNGSSQVASLFTQQGKKGTNQDAMIVWEVRSLSIFICSALLAVEGVSFIIPEVRQCNGLEIVHIIN